ncbi:MAG: PLP-dependent aminotransferase family protein [Pyrinomonadaceae bacterium]
MREVFNLELFLSGSIKRDNESQTLVEKISESLRKAILLGRIGVGAKLPSSRRLASELKVSRNTVLAAYEQLISEGYLEGKRGSGSFVAKELPEDLLQALTTNKSVAGKISSGRAVAKRTERIQGLALSFSNEPDKPRAFQIGFSAIAEFPIETWTRIFTRRLRNLPRKSLDYSDPRGYLPLRESIAKYLGASRGVSCEASQVFITAGSQQALDAIFRTLLDEGDDALIEDPNYLGARGALLAAGAKLIPVPLDKEGFDIRLGSTLSPRAKLAYVTPSHQFPFGVTMSLSRRLELLEWASRKSAWIIEDDYDSEFRYRGRPLAALHGLDTSGRVVYTGTFSKVLFPSLRLGYLVVPPDLAGVFEQTLTFMAFHASMIEQAVLTDFINEGHFGRHIRKMRILYAERQKTIISAIGEDLSGVIEAQDADAGMHIIGWLKGGLKAQVVANEALKNGVYTPPLSFFCMNAKPPEGLLMGYTGLSNTEIRRGVRRLANVLSKMKL